MEIYKWSRDDWKYTTERAHSIPLQWGARFSLVVKVEVEVEVEVEVVVMLFSLMDMKPPISRAKMILITKAAIKAIKLYKHVVQIVEKFIKKCKPEYKVPGLYVIDSIVRQSRHQFGTDKDVFGPRFSKNITATFQYLYLCPSEDKSKIVRVLNLWQKNGVFKIEIIQPLLDMAAGTSNAAPGAENVTNNEGSPPPPVKVSSELPQAPTNSMPAVPQLPSSDAFAAVAQLFQTTQGQQLQQILQTFQQPPKPQSPALDSAVMAQVQAITAQLKTAPTQPPEQKTAFDKVHEQALSPYSVSNVDLPENIPKGSRLETGAGSVLCSLEALLEETVLGKDHVQMSGGHLLAAFLKLLDRFDYDDEPEAVEDSKKEDAVAVATTALATAAPPVPAAATPAVAPAVPASSATSPPPPQAPFGYPGDGMQQPAYTQHQNVDQFQPRMMALQQDSMQHQVWAFSWIDLVLLSTAVTTESAKESSSSSHQKEEDLGLALGLGDPATVGLGPGPGIGAGTRLALALKKDGIEKKRGSGGRKASLRSSQRLQVCCWIVTTDLLSVCSTTLWVGQLDKRTTQQDVASLLEEFGPIESINMIPPRGCAYIVMVHRQDAYRALQKLSRGNYKVNQKSIKIAWALNKGIKADFKQYWDVELGVTYIPWDKVKAEELESFCEGGMLDSDTLNPDWKGIPKKPENEVAQNGGAEASHTEPVSPIPKPVPVPVPALPVPAPITVPPPQVPPHQPGPPVVGALQPPAFTPPLGIPPPGFGPGVPPPPPPPPPFLRPGFNPMHLPPGFLPPGPPPPITPPVSIPPPHTPPISIPNSTIAGINEDTTKDLSIGNPIPTVVSGARGNAESADSAKMYGSAGPPAAPTSLPTPPVTQPVSLLAADGDVYKRPLTSRVILHVRLLFFAMSRGFEAGLTWRLLS
uniref:LRRGT00100 n=2 Tax=Rattus norvegicus TaxID=10116 RepID=Q6TUE4_RAT|nr:LRRGT00100 [Rattus norvegicus]